MRVLVVGSGRARARAGAGAGALRGSPELLCAPGNAGIAQRRAPDRRGGRRRRGDRRGGGARGRPLHRGGARGAAGGGARGRARPPWPPGLRPSAAAARLESSKAFAKQLMEEAGVPTACWRHAHTLEEGMAAVAELADPGVVVKADGLAAGKGVTVADSPEQARGGAARDLRRGPLLEWHRRPPGPHPTLRRHGRERGRRRAPDRQGALADGAVRRQARLPAGAGARLQAHLRRRSRPEHRRDGRVLAGGGAARAKRSGTSPRSSTTRSSD